MPASANHAPIATASNVSLAHGQSISASSLFSVSDSYAASPYTTLFRSSTADAASGSFKINGAIQQASKAIDVSAAQLASATFAAGSGSDQLWVRGFAGV